MNLYRAGTSDGSLDKQYLRTCAVYRLLKQKRIGFQRAIELLAERNPPSMMKTMRGTVELWRANTLKDMLA